MYGYGTYNSDTDTSVTERHEPADTATLEVRMYYGDDHGREALRSKP